MILLDTSVWIEFFQQNEPIASQVSTLLSEQKVITVEPVFSELMFGARNAQEKSVIRTYWQILPRAEFGEESLFETSSSAMQYDYQDKGIGLIDAVIIGSTQRGGHLLWTLDEKIISIMDGTQLFHLTDSGDL
ncbi:MAG: PIN domain-containing protein [Bacteroidales bacterium]|nr:PIN domain-containing protein [Bacteroidales bacterium]